MTRNQANSFRAAIETQRTAASDQTAVRSIDLYDTWERLVETEYVAKDPGYRFRYGKTLYKTKQPVQRFAAEWVPGIGTDSLFEVIDIEHAGTEADPIPYNGNMELVSGLYYTQNGVLYVCTRNTDAPVYHNLSELVGIYVEIVQPT